MTNLPGSRPVVTLYLDPAGALLPDGSLAQYWGRFLVNFTATFAERRYAVVLDMGDHPDPAASVDAQSYVVAGVRAHYAVDAQELPFGQLLVAPGVHPLFAPDVSFEHDCHAIARDLLAQLPGTRELLVVDRPADNDYLDRILAALAAVIPVSDADRDEVSRAETHQTVFSFQQYREEVVQLAARLPSGVGLVSQGEPFANDYGIVFLDLRGADCGTTVARAVGDALEGREVGTVALPYRIAVWT